MARLINTADLYNEIMKHKDELGVLSVDIVNWFESIVRCVPTAEEPTAEWIIARKGIKVTEYKCSKCGIIIYDDTGYDVTADYPYCHCGCRMKEVE